MKNSSPIPLFIYGPPKTGTTLLARMLDGSNILVYPNEIKYKTFAIKKYNSKHKLIYEYKQKNKDPLKVPVKRIKYSKKISVENLNKLDGKLESVKATKSALNFKEYYTEFNNIIHDNYSKLTGSTIIWYDMLAFKNALISPPSDIKYIAFKDVGGDYKRVIQNYLHTFKSGKMLLITRNPYAQFYSRLKFWQKNNWKVNNRLSQILSLLRLNDFYKCNNIKNNKQILRISYEELVDNTNDVMKRISNFLAISYNDELLFPSVLGTKTVVATATKSTNIVFKDSLYLWEKKLNKKEKRMVTATTPDAVKHNYKHIEKARKMLKLLATTKIFRLSLELYFKFHIKLLHFITKFKL